MERRLLVSVDVGVRNLGVALFSFGQSEPGRAEALDVRVVDSGAATDASDTIRRTVEALERDVLGGELGALYSAANEVVVENQPAMKNPRMRAVQAAVQAFFFMRVPGASQTLASASSKTTLAAEVLVGRGARATEVSGGTYSGTKKATVDAMFALLRDGRVLDGGGRCLAALSCGRKKDDMADALMQGLAHAASRGICRLDLLAPNPGRVTAAVP